MGRGKHFHLFHSCDTALLAVINDIRLGSAVRTHEVARSLQVPTLHLVPVSCAPTVKSAFHMNLTNTVYECTLHEWGRMVRWRSVRDPPLTHPEHPNPAVPPAAPQYHIAPYVPYSHTVTCHRRMIHTSQTSVGERARNAQSAELTLFPPVALQTRVDAGLVAEQYLHAPPL